MDLILNSSFGGDDRHTLHGGFRASDLDFVGNRAGAKNGVIQNNIYATGGMRKHCKTRCRRRKACFSGD